MRNILGRGCLIPFANAPENSTVPNECLHSHLLAEIKNFLVVFLLSRCGWLPEIVDGGKSHIKTALGQFFITFKRCVSLGRPTPVGNHEWRIHRGRQSGWLNFCNLVGRVCFGSRHTKKFELAQRQATGRAIDPIHCAGIKAGVNDDSKVGESFCRAGEVGFGNRLTGELGCDFLGIGGRHRLVHARRIKRREQERLEARVGLEGAFASVFRVADINICPVILGTGVGALNGPVFRVAIRGIGAAGRNGEMREDKGVFELDGGEVGAFSGWPTVAALFEIHIPPRLFGLVHEDASRRRTHPTLIGMALMGYRVGSADRRTGQFEPGGFGGNHLSFRQSLAWIF